ncbi:hypothetical protein Vretifemale_13726 [Volvox reticuliferus]|uniref:Uncharacterized protein n=1 Tax=Volvox reticuliferus TaxID=1737510 RepID=A0A8J4CN44_9CHLO|nr:hypothetical protein Vretifemale_13726 [Volvox reticuliferus]
MSYSQLLPLAHSRSAPLPETATPARSTATQAAQLNVGAETQTDVTPPTVQLPVPEAFGAQVTPTVTATTVLTPAASVEGDVEMVNAAGPSTSRPPHGAPTAALAVNHPEMKKKGRPQQHKLRGQSAATHDDLAPTKFYDVNDRNIPYGVYVKRRAARVCLCCRSKDHHYNECPRRPQHRPPVAGGDPAVGPIIQ